VDCRSDAALTTGQGEVLLQRLGSPQKPDALV
jgi:hypothetical protein